MSQTVIQTQNLSKTFGTFPALTDLSINIEQGITTGLVGPNGAGKTTLFSLLCGFLQATKGNVKVLGLPPSHPGLKGRVSILPQDASFLKALAVGKQLAMLAELQGFKKQDATAESTRVLSLVRMSESRNQVPESLSHGMLKRIAIAQAFIGSPEIIMLDEPTAGLDPNTADGIKSVIRDLCKRTTFIISSHNLEVIEDLCQKIVILKKGRLHSHENISDLTARTQALTFRLERDPDSNISEIFTSLPMVSGVTLGKPGQHRIVVHYNGEGQHIEIEILKCLAQANISYREMIRGERLQESVADRLD